MNKYILIAGVLVVGGVAYWLLSNQATNTDTSTVSQTPVVTSGEGAPEGSIHNMPAEPAAEVARADLMTKLSIDRNSIVIMSVEEKTWSDGCLGLGGAAESCLQALIEGFRVELLAKGKTYFYRTDKTGASLRAEE